MNANSLLLVYHIIICKEYLKSAEKHETAKTAAEGAAIEYSIFYLQPHDYVIMLPYSVE
jgi:hypothetical protein